MKKTLFIAALALISAGCVAQKANVKEVKTLIYGESADYNKARQLIQEALTNEETKDLAETWYMAAMIGYQQSEQQLLLKQMGQNLDQETAGQAVMESYDYLLKADELASVMTLDKKGREVMTDAKTHKNVQKMMKEYYSKQLFPIYGIFLNDQRDFAGAYHAFMNHLNIPNLPMMQDEKSQADMPKDSTYNEYTYYAALFAIQAEMHPEAIALLEQLKSGSYEAISVNQFLYQEYVTTKDTANFVQVLKDAMVRFPQEPWFLQNLINYYIFSNQESMAIDYLNQAIEREPEVAQYHLIMGNLKENKQSYEEAIAEFDRALQLDPKMADAAAGKGRVYYNQAVKMNEDAANIMDAKEYKLALEDMNEMFRQSLPFFEQAHKMDPANRDYMITLKGLYYRFSMEAEYNAIQEELNK